MSRESLLSIQSHIPEWVLVGSICKFNFVPHDVHRDATRQRSGKSPKQSLQLQGIAIECKSVQGKEIANRRFTFLVILLVSRFRVPKQRKGLRCSANVKRIIICKMAKLSTFRACKVESD